MRPTGGRRRVLPGSPGCICRTTRATPGRAPRAAAGRSGPAMEAAEAAPDRVVSRPVSGARRRGAGDLDLRGVLPPRGGGRGARRGRLRRPVPRGRRLIPRSTRDPRPDPAGPPPARPPRRPPPDAARPLPEVGETIAGFRLVEELGRGSFARVFRAEERQLADRPVAMKVTRTGSREPQTLARLQHTHIVPVYSYRTDPATGLHLLCMPYLGRLTLAQVLADPAIRNARSGADLRGFWIDFRPPTASRCGGSPRRPAGRSTDGPMPGRSPGGGRGSPRRSSTPTTAGYCTATSSRRTSWSPTTACRCSSISTSRRSPGSMTPRPRRPRSGGPSPTWRRNSSRRWPRGVPNGSTPAPISMPWVSFSTSAWCGARDRSRCPPRSKSLTEALLRAAEAAAGRASAGAQTHPDVPAAFEAVVAPLPGRRPGRSLRLGVGAGGRPPGGGRRRPARLRPRAAGPAAPSAGSAATGGGWRWPRPCSWHWGSPLACWSAPSSPRCASRPRSNTGSTRPDIRPKGAGWSSP